VKITTIITGIQNTDNSIIRNVPVTSTIIEFTGNNLAIIDTGMADNPEFVEELVGTGYKPSDFDLVINTHLHCDHIGGNRLFNNARILISKKEYEYEMNFEKALQESEDPVMTLSSLGRKVDESASMLAWDLKKLAEKYPVSSLVGDTGQIEFFENSPYLPFELSLIPVPGHSIDSYAVRLKGHNCPALVSGDALYHRDLWKGASVPGINYNEKKFKESTRLISIFKGVIIPGHDYAFDNISGKYLENDSFYL